MLNFWSSKSNSGEIDEKSLEASSGSRGQEIVKFSLPTGNLITEAPEITNRIHNLRKDSIEQLDYARSQIQSFVDAAAEKKQRVEEYTQQHILTDKEEVDTQLVPGAILAVGSFFTGRILTNRANWGYHSLNMVRQQNLLGRVATSMVARWTVPWILAASVFHKCAPNTYNRLVETAENELLPHEFVAQYHDAYAQIRERSSQLAKTISQDQVQARLQRGIHSMRQFICDVLY